MSDAVGRRRARTTATTSLTATMSVAAGLVAANVVLMLALSYTPVADLGRVLFSNYFLGIAVFAVTVGGGHWLATRAVDDGAVPLAAGGVVLVQVGYGLFGAALLAGVASSLRAPALGVTAVVTAAITAVVTAVVYRVDHSFRRWNLYAAGLFVVGFLVGAAGVFVANVLLAVASLCFLVAFLAYLAHEIWAVKTSDHPGTLVNAIGIYVAVMGVFVHVLSWVLRIMSAMDQ